MDSPCFSEVLLQGIVAAGLTQYQAYTADEVLVLLYQDGITMLYSLSLYSYHLGAISEWVCLCCVWDRLLFWYLHVQVMTLLQRGNLNRTTEPTRINETSSRSHAILQASNFSLDIFSFCCIYHHLYTINSLSILRREERKNVQVQGCEKLMGVMMAGSCRVQSAPGDRNGGASRQAFTDRLGRVRASTGHWSAHFEVSGGCKHKPFPPGPEQLHQCPVWREKTHPLQEFQAHPASKGMFFPPPPYNGLQDFGRGGFFQLNLWWPLCAFSWNQVLNGYFLCAQDSLGGSCRTAMIANISPSNFSFGETQNTLHWADRAKEIRTKVSFMTTTHDP